MGFSRRPDPFLHPHRTRALISPNRRQPARPTRPSRNAAVNPRAPTRPSRNAAVNPRTPIPPNRHPDTCAARPYDASIPFNARANHLIVALASIRAWAFLHPSEAGFPSFSDSENGVPSDILSVPRRENRVRDARIQFNARLPDLRAALLRFSQGNHVQSRLTG